MTMTDVEHQQAPAGEPVSRKISENGSSGLSDNQVDLAHEIEKKESARSDGKRELKEEDCYEVLAYCWPRWKKWTYLCAVAFVQVSMNFNTSVFPNAVVPLSKAFNIGQQEARTGQMIYLVLYSFGCELWAPWSEEFGRWPILQLSMFLINIWQIPCAVAPNWGTIVVCRGLVRSTRPPNFHLIIC
jgi:Arabinose efflux permease